MMKEIQDIEDSCYGASLKKMLYQQQKDHPDSIEVDLFIKLCSINIKNFDPQFFDNEVLDNFSALNDLKNKEISARWREYLSVRFPKNKKEFLPKAVFLYLDIFNLTNDPDYLIHALKLARAVKALFTDIYLESMYQLAKKTILEINISQPFLIKEIIIELIYLKPLQLQEDFDVLLKDWIENLQSIYDFTGAHHFISILKEIKLISGIDSKIKFAENYEKKGDYENRDKMPNTYYPTTLSYYQNALREIKSINGQDELKNRLHAKIITEQAEHAKMHLAVARNYNDQNNELENFINEQLKHWLSLLTTYDFKSGLHNLLTFPISLGNISKETSLTDSSFLSPLFDTAIKQDSKGRNVGKTTLEMYFQILERRSLREAIIAFIRKTKWRMDEEKKIDKDYVQLLIEKLDVQFIPQDRKVIFVNGIFAGFNNDYITAAHLLIPQLENSFKHILESKNIISFKINEEIQHDNTLGGILDILIDKTQHDIFYELKDFLIENSSVNFRNELCHGILEPFIIEHYGVYVWWLTLKMIYDYDEIFKFDNKSKNHS